MTKWLYLFTAALGLALPWYFFLAFISDNGLNLSLFLRQLFANHISTFFALDLLITAAAIVIYLCLEERKRTGSRWWLFTLLTLAVGPSCSLPLFLYFRERHKENGIIRK